MAINRIKNKVNKFVKLCDLKSLWKTLFYPPLFLLFKISNHFKKIIQTKKIQPLGPKKTTVLIIIVFTILITAEIFSIQKQIPNNDDFLILKLTKSRDNAIVENNLIDEKDKDKKEKGDFRIAARLDKINQEKFSGPGTILGGAAIAQPEISDLEELSPARTDVEIYVVQAGDTVSSIAKKFDISVESILWENKLSANSTLKPGQELKILPISGLTHKVVYGDTLSSISQKYQTSIEDIIDFNNLADVSDIFIGDVLIIPFGKKPPPPKPKPAPTPQAKPKVLFVNENYSNYREWLKHTQCHRFVSGQCTSWVAYKWATQLGRCIPWTGHAKYWLSRAKNAGFRIGSRADGPQVGAIIVLRESGWAARAYGHVGYVESFDDKTVTFSEMNFKGAWTITKRTYERNNWRITGYIYSN